MVVKTELVEWINLHWGGDSIRNCRQLPLLTFWLRGGKDIGPSGVSEDSGTVAKFHSCGRITFLLCFCNFLFYIFWCNLTPLLFIFYRDGCKLWTKFSFKSKWTSQYGWISSCELLILFIKKLKQCRGAWKESILIIKKFTVTFSGLSDWREMWFSSELRKGANGTLMHISANQSSLSDTDSQASISHFLIPQFPVIFIAWKSHARIYLFIIIVGFYIFPSQVPIMSMLFNP